MSKISKKVITISNSESFLKKIKNLFTTSNESKVQIDDNQNTKTKEEIKENLNNFVSLLQDELSGDLDCLNSLENYQSSATKNILFKVDKSKFNYPTAKSTTLQVKSNLPIIKNIQYSQEKKQSSDNIQIENFCTSKDIYGSYTIDYTLAQVKLLVDFSVILYNTINTDIEVCPEDISNLDIYALEETSFIDEPFDFCYIGDCVGLTPYDFGVEINTLQQKVSPIYEFDDYYLYLVGVRISINFLPPITINTDDTQTLAAINEQLGEPPTNNVFTRGQLASITYLNLSNNTNLDFDIFQYLFNLVELDISSTTSDSVKLSKLSVLNRLEVLIAKNNNIEDYTPFANLTNLRELYLDNNLTSTFTKTFAALVAYDITPLTNLINLRVLSLVNNNISIIPPQISKLTNLTMLILNNNNIADLSNLYGLENLSIEAENQSIDYGDLNPDVDDITMFILDLSFLKDVDFTTPNIFEISNGGIYVDDESSAEPTIVWENITEPTLASFTFANISKNFTGTVTVNLAVVNTSV